MPQGAFPPAPSFDAYPPRFLVQDGASFRVRPAPWHHWLSLLDGACSGHPWARGALLPDRLLGRWLPGYVDRADSPEGPWSLLRWQDIDRLPTLVADSLVRESLALLDDQRSALGLTVLLSDDDLLVQAGERQLVLREWSFGERNRQLGRFLRAEGDRVLLDTVALEIATVVSCSSWRQTDIASVEKRIAAEEVERWPIPLGETVTDQLDLLNQGPSGRQQIVERCQQQGLDHPDLVLAELCLGFGWAPDIVEGLPASTAMRLLQGLRLLGATRNSAPFVPPQSVDDFTRIVVRDD